MQTHKNPTESSARLLTATTIRECTPRRHEALDPLPGSARHYAAITVGRVQ